MEYDCRIGFLGHKFVKQDNPYVAATTRWILGFFPKVNCSTTVLSMAGDSNIKTNSSGFYEETSLFGGLQSKKINILAMFVKMDTLENPFPLRIDVPLFGSKAVIANVARNESSQELDILQTIVTFDLLVYLYVAIAVFFVFAVTSHVMFKWTIVKSVWTTSTGMIGQINDDHEMISHRILWISYLAFLFFFIYGIMGGLISADMTMAFREPRVERLEDFFDDKFNTTPVSLKQEFVYDRLMRAGNGSLEHRVIDRMIERGSLIDNSDHDETNQELGMSKMQSVFYAFTKPDYAFLEHEVFVEKALFGACVIADKKEPIFVPGKEAFGEDMFAFPYSEDIKYELRKKFSTHLSRILQAGLFPIELDKLMDVHLMSTVPFQFSRKYYDCASFEFFRRKEIYEKLHPSLPSAMNILHAKGAFVLLIVFSVFSALILMIEKSGRDHVLINFLNYLPLNYDYALEETQEMDNHLNS